MFKKILFSFRICIIFYSILKQCTFLKTLLLPNLQMHSYSHKLFDFDTYKNILRNKCSHFMQEKKIGDICFAYCYLHTTYGSLKLDTRFCTPQLYLE